MSRSSGHRKSRRRQFAVSHQKNWLIGRYAVLETLRADRWPIAELYLDAELPATDPVVQLASQMGVVASRVPAARLTELCHASHHQGMAARMGAFPYFDTAWLLESLRAAAGNPPPLIVICDRIQDTHNLGAILRTCDAVAAMAMVIGHHEQAAVSPQVSRSSAGAVNHVPVVVSESLPETVQQLSATGVRIAAASEKAASEYWSADLAGPVGLVVGSEASGVSETLLEQVDCGLRIPMMGQVGSLNAAVAASVVLYEIRRQQAAAATS